MLLFICPISWSPIKAKSQLALQFLLQGYPVHNLPGFEPCVLVFPYYYDRGMTVHLKPASTCQI
jgi:hypothetical protein